MGNIKKIGMTLGIPKSVIEKSLSHAKWVELLVQTNEHQNIKKEIKQTIFSFNVPILKNPPHGKNLLQCWKKNRMITEQFSICFSFQGTEYG